MFYFPTFRHRVELLVSDKMDDAVFVAFHMQMAKLTNIQVAEAAQILVSTLFNQLILPKLLFTCLGF